MALMTTFRHGEPQMIDYVPAAGNVNTGDVVQLGNLTGLCMGIAHHDIPNNVQGALSLGGGIYDVVNLNNAANYAKVWWDATNTKITTVSTNNMLFGFVVENGGLGANTVCRARHYSFV